MLANPFGLWAISDQQLSIVQAALAENKFRPYLSGHPDVSPAQIAACSDTPFSYEGWYADRLSIGQPDAQVPVIPIKGMMMQGSMYDNVFSNDFIIAMFNNIAANDKKKGVILDFNTGGGQVQGVTEFVQAVRALVQKKPVVASVTFAASAGFWVASQTSEIHMRPGPVSSIGSIGTMYIHMNRAKALAQAGLDPEIFRSTGSVDKNTQNDIEELSEQARADIQTALDMSNKAFKADVRIGRGPKIKSQSVYTGKLYATADAIREGLADRQADLLSSYQRVIQLSKNYA
ncbi:S49 family peptidase [Spirosoma pomorum]